MRATVLASVISGAVGVFLAWRGWGVWSLAWQTVVATLVSTVVLWWICAWRPTLTFSFAALRSLFRFGSFMFLSGLLESAYSRLHVAVIGRLYSARDLGLYTRADATQQLPVTTISGLLGRVAFPVFVAAADDQVVLRRAIRKALTVITLLNAPMMLGLLAVSRPLVMCLFGEKWLPCVPYLQVFCLSGVFYPWHVINLQVIKSVGRSDLFFRLEVIKKVLGLTALLVAAPLGVLAMVWSRPIVSLLCYFVNAYYTGRLACYPAGRQIRDMGSALVAASVMLALVWPITTLGWTPAILTLGIQVMAGVTIFSGLCLLCRIESAGYVLAEAKEFWRRRSRPATIVPAGTKNA
jgi:O-antigen/teichoic acid export membrane protein